MILKLRSEPVPRPATAYAKKGRRRTMAAASADLARERRWKVSDQAPGIEAAAGVLGVTPPLCVSRASRRFPYPTETDVSRNPAGGRTHGQNVNSD